jgi:hypothetical protein
MSSRKNKRRLVVGENNEMNIFGILGIFVLLSGLGSGVMVALILMENFK